MIEDILLTVFCLALWGALHSITAASGFKAWWRKRLGKRMAFYRLGYNLFSLLTLAAVAVAMPWNDTVIYDLQSPLREGFRVLAVLAGVLFLITLRQLGLSDLAGVTPIRRYLAGKYAVEEQADSGIQTELVTTGFYRVSRHPLYLFAVLLFFLEPRMTVSYATLAVTGTTYLYAGSIFEERKLVREFGEAYRTYQRRVSGILPWKWMLRKL